MKTMSGAPGSFRVRVWEWGSVWVRLVLGATQEGGDDWGVQSGMTLDAAALGAPPLWDFPCFPFFFFFF